MQQIGEAKCIRAMFYHDLVVGWGDIPFRTKQSFGDEDLNIGLTDRREILTWLINDLKSIGPKMKYADMLPHGVERISKNFCNGLIARMAMTRGGYALYPDKADHWPSERCSARPTTWSITKLPKIMPIVSLYQKKFTGKTFPTGVYR